MNYYCCVVILFLISLINLTFTAVYDQTATHPDHPGKCYDKSTEHIFSIGEEFQPSGRCFIYKCIKPGHILGTGCNYVNVDDCEPMGMDFTKKMPECCPKFSCKIENGNNIIINPSVE